MSRRRNIATGAAAGSRRASAVLAVLLLATVLAGGAAGAQQTQDTAATTIPGGDQPATTQPSPTTTPSDGSAADGDDDTLLIVAVGLAVVALIVAVTAIATRRRTRSDVAADGALDQAWRTRAGGATEDGELVLQLLATAESAGPGSGLDPHTLGVAESRLNLLLAQISEVSASAPTEMDARVARGVGIRASALAETLLSEQRILATPTGTDSALLAEVGDDFRQRRSELELAIRDLRRHVQLF